jgi:hypothetical protein
VYGAGDAVLDGYRVSYVTVANNGLYGLYAFAARNGVFEHSYASGHPDSGFYVGQCRPCNAVLRHLYAEGNAIGYYGTNASGDVWIVESVFVGNRLGIAPNSQDAELLAPQEQSFVVGNLVVDNQGVDTPEIMDGFFGAGIAVGGGTRTWCCATASRATSVPASSCCRSAATTRPATRSARTCSRATGTTSCCA